MMNPFEALTLIAADSISELRRLHVYRVLDASQSVSNVDTKEYAAWISDNRPDLAKEVTECLAHLGLTGDAA